MEDEITDHKLQRITYVPTDHFILFIRPSIPSFPHNFIVLQKVKEEPAITKKK